MRSNSKASDGPIFITGVRMKIDEKEDGSPISPKSIKKVQLDDLIVIPSAQISPTSAEKD